MKQGGGCTLLAFHIGGKRYPRSASHFDEPGGNCHDCGAKHGCLHHAGCDVERCPKCNRQSITCDCEVIIDPPRGRLMTVEQLEGAMLEISAFAINLAQHMDAMSKVTFLTSFVSNFCGNQTDKEFADMHDALLNQPFAVTQGDLLDVATKLREVHKLNHT